MNEVRVDQIAATWESFQAASGLGHIANERHYDQVIELMNRIADDGAMNPAHRSQEIGSQGVVSEKLSGKRDLNKSHIAALSKRFSVSPAVFF
jgi:HTH-type transcriptional regulator / antitoxin HigA